MSRLPIISVPKGLANTNTGLWLYDCMPLFTMAACVPTLFLYYRAKRWADLALFSLGFVLAVVYHICHMAVDGLQSSTILGISGPLWRTFDIICAQWLLARTFGHAVGASHWVTQVLTNTVFPAVCLYYFWTATEQLPMKNIMHTLMAVILAALAAKLLVEGVDTLPKYCRKRGAKALAGYYELYALIEFDSNTVYNKAQQHKRLRAEQQTGPSLKQGVTVSEADKIGPSQEMMAGQLANKESTLPIDADSADSEASTGTDFDLSESRLCRGTQPMVAGVPGSSKLRKY
ncbi:TPA: hypothetical protein ACH3X1_011578 [Trebouxia sp. C0004]